MAAAEGGQTGFPRSVGPLVPCTCCMLQVVCGSLCLVEGSSSCRTVLLANGPLCLPTSPMPPPPNLPPPLPPLQQQQRYGGPTSSSSSAGFSASSLSSSPQPRQQAGSFDEQQQDQPMVYTPALDFPPVVSELASQLANQPHTPTPHTWVAGTARQE